MQTRFDFSTTPRPRVILLATIITLALVFVVFGRSLVQQFAPLDDGFLIVKNLAARGVSMESLRLAFTTYDPELYIPLTLVSFQINYLFGGLQPFNYHFVNILLHAANALLVMWMCLLITRQRLAAFIAGLLFAIHPLHTEAVVWLAGRKDLLSTFFALLAFIAYLRYRNGSVRAYGGSVIAFLLALLAKVMPITLPVSLLLCDLLLEKRRDWRMLILDKIPFFTLSAVFAVIAIAGKKSILAETGIFETVLMSSRSIAFYLQKFFAPFNLSMLYPYGGEISIAEPLFLFSLLLIIALGGLTLWLWRHAPSYAFGLLFFLVALSPTLPHFRRGEEVYFAVDRYAYLPSVGLFLILAIVLSRILKYWEWGWKLWIPIAIVFGTFAPLSMAQTRLWDSPILLFSHTLQLYPESIQARTELAGVLRRQEKYEDAFETLREGLQYSDHIQLYLHAGYIYAETGNTESARKEFLKAQEMAPANPNPSFALASLNRQQGNVEEAREQYRAVLALDPSFVIARVHLAQILREEGGIEEAERQLHEAIRWHPSSKEAHVVLAQLLWGNKQMEEAIHHLRTALHIDPEDGDVKRLLEVLESQRE